ncbi:hypothetical protein M9H77_25248 [Catharanthus roseus]|uniref:Uncharacterized protein n=1 Tax=Catharanthus roseus TaxID=4058 RepID=A0ACC0A6D3_CATRO|nr:hypothetical protein M9H77_25248 [Catharanthus roseus]
MENISDCSWMYRERGPRIKGLTSQFINGELDLMSHPRDGEAWKHFDRIYFDFLAELRNRAPSGKGVELLGRVKSILPRIQLMRKVEDAVSRVSVAFKEHIRRLFEHNQLAHILFPPMMPLIRVAMSADTSTSTSTIAVAGTSELLTRFSSTLPIYSCSRTHLSFTRPRGWCSSII